MNTTKKQYEKYIPLFKKSCILKSASGALTVITIILTIFVPILNILGEGYSLFDYGKQVVISALDFSSFNSFYWLLNWLGFIGIACIIPFVISVITELVKTVPGILDTDAYSLLKYDTIKKGIDTKERKKQARSNNYYQLVYGLILIFAQMFFAGETFLELLKTTEFWSPFLYIDILLIVGSIVLAIISGVNEKSITVAILKDDYCSPDTDAPEEAPKSAMMEQFDVLKQLLTDGIITQEEFEAKKKQILGIGAPAAITKTPTEGTEEKADGNTDGSNKPKRLHL